MFARSVSAIATLIFVMGGAGAFTTAIAQINQDSQSSLQWPLQLAQNQPRSRQNRGNWLKELNLSQEQLTKIKAIRQQYQAQLNQQRQALQQANQELRQLMTTNASAAKIRDKFDQVQTLRQNLARTRLNSMLAIREVLNPQQRQKLGEWLGTKNKGRRGNWRGDEVF